MTARHALILSLMVTATAWPRAAGAQAAAPKAQQPPPPPIVMQEKVEVVATRIPMAPHDVPASIEVLTGEDLRTMGASTLKQALSLAAGVEISPGGDGGPASSVPEFWGLREFDAFLLVVDGVPWGGAFNPAMASLSLRDVERIEILRGAAPVTFGATSFVGVIYVVHKAAAADNRYLTAKLGTLSSGGLGLEMAVPSPGLWKSRVSGDIDREGAKDLRTAYVRGHVLWRASKTEADRTTWFTMDLSLLRQNPGSPHPRDGGTLSADVPLDSNYNPQLSFLNENRFNISFGRERPFKKDLRFGYIVSYTHTGQSQFRGFLTQIADVPDNALGLREKIGINDLYLDTHLFWPERGHWQFTAGADFLHGSGAATGATFTYKVPLAGVPATTVAKPTTLGLATNDRREFFGTYGQAEWKPNPRLHVSAGARLNVTYETGSGSDAAVVADATSDSGTHAWLTSSAGAIFNVHEQGVNHVRVFGNFRNTFKPAAFDFGLGELGAARHLLEPETAQSYEGGVKVRQHDGKVDFEASMFRMNFNNLVTSTVVGGLPALMNAGKTRFQGFEMSSDMRFRHNVSGRFTYSFHDGRFVDFVQAFDGVPTQLGGNRFEMSARHLVSGGVFYSKELGIVGSLIVKYSGDRYLNKRNTALTPSFTTVDLGLGYRFLRCEMRLDARNLTNRRDPVSESELGDAQYYRMIAREVMFSLGLRF
jgi:outer membrane receptor protein involved in Fe transport